MAGPGALLPKTVPAPSNCWYRASTSRSLPHTAISALVSAGVHDMPRQAAAAAAAALLPGEKETEGEAPTPPPPEPAPAEVAAAAAVTDPAPVGPSGEAPLGVEGSERLGLPSLSAPGEPGDSTSILGILSGDSAAESCEEPQGAAILGLRGSAGGSDGENPGGGASARRRQQESQARGMQKRKKRRSLARAGRGGVAARGELGGA